MASEANLQFPKEIARHLLKRSAVREWKTGNATIRRDDATEDRGADGRRQILVGMNSF